MGYYTHQTPGEAAVRIAAGDRVAALAWVEQVGSYPPSDPEVAQVTHCANRLLGFPTGDVRNTRPTRTA